MFGALTKLPISMTHFFLGASILAIGAGFFVPVGDESAAQWLIDLCLPASEETPDIAPIAMEHNSHLAAKAAGALALLSAVLLYFGLRRHSADPDKLLAAMAYMANATPGQSARELSRAVEDQTGFAISAADAAEALACYRGPPSQADLDWLSEGTTRDQASRTLSAAVSIGWKHDGISPDGVRTIASLAQAFGWSGDDVAALLPIRRTPQDNYDLFPVIDSVSHWIGRVVAAFKHKPSKSVVGAFS